MTISEMFDVDWEPDSSNRIITVLTYKCTVPGCGFQTTVHDYAEEHIRDHSFSQ